MLPFPNSLVGYPQWNYEMPQTDTSPDLPSKVVQLSSEDLDTLLDRALDLFDGVPLPTLGLPESDFFVRGEIDPETVDKAVSSIQQACLALVSSMVEGTERMGVSAFGWLTKKVLDELDGNLKIKKTSEMALSTEKPYSLTLTININDIDESTPTGLLVSQLSKKITQSGQLDLRFEQGCLDSLTPYWHFDPKISPFNTGSKYSIITTYSNKTNWSTRILNPKHNDVLNGQSRANEKIIGKVEELSEPTQFGCLYDGQCVFHRSPMEKDLKGDLKISDYRLFIRFFSKT